MGAARRTTTRTATAASSPTRTAAASRLSDRSLIPDDVILPMYDDSGNRLSYSLEPQFPADTIDTLPEHRVGLEQRRAVGAGHRPGRQPCRSRHRRRSSASRATARRRRRRRSRPGRPPAVRALHGDGHGLDRRRRGPPLRGRRHVPLLDRQADDTGDGDLPGHAVPGRLQLRPRHPVQPAGPGRRRRSRRRSTSNSDPANVRTLVVFAGKASTAGHLRRGAGHEVVSARRAGEYHAQVLATYTDPDGHLWVCTMRHAGVVYAENVAGHRAREEALGRRQVRRARRDASSRATSRPNGDAAPGPHHVPVPGGRRAADRRRGPGREQDRAGAHLPDAGRHVGRGTRS